MAELCVIHVSGSNLLATKEIMAIIKKGGGIAAQDPGFRYLC